MNIILFGPPGAGKGTLAQYMKDRLSIAHLSTGDVLRDEMAQKTDIGLKAKLLIDQGELVDDDLVISLIKKRIEDIVDRQENGYMLDGFPRNKEQALALDNILDEVKQPLEYAFYMETSPSMIVWRITGRRICSECKEVYHIENRPPKQAGICDRCGGSLYQRDDDNEETITKRMNVYFENTAPMIEYYKAQGKLKTIDGDKDPDVLMAEVMAIVDEC